VKRRPAIATPDRVVKFPSLVSVRATIRAHKDIRSKYVGQALVCDATGVTGQRHTSLRVARRAVRGAAMAENQNKTKPTGASVEDYIASRANEEQRADCKALMSILKRITKQQPKMWGPSIVGYGSYHYTYESGRTGEMCLTGLAIRGRELVVYLMADGEEQKALRSRLGKHKMGKSCLYFKRLGDLDQTVLEQLVANSVADVKRRYGPAR
jgi:Domain of unknown function (DU1801)